MARFSLNQEREDQKWQYQRSGMLQVLDIKPERPYRCFERGHLRCWSKFAEDVAARQEVHSKT